MTQPKSKRVPRAVREQQMLDAAVQVFGGEGYHRAGVDQIAEQAGISKPMVYLYFGSKEELFLACIRREAARLMEMLSGVVVESDPPQEQLWRALLAFFTFVSDHSGAWKVLVRQASDRGEQAAGEVAVMRQRIVDLITTLLARAAGADEPGPEAVIAAHALVGACESLSDWMLEETEADPELTAKRLLQFAWPGLSNLLEATRSKRVEQS